MIEPLLIDAHSHINFRAFRDDADVVIARAEAEHIWMTAVGSQIDTSRRAVEYAEKYPHIWAVVGLHPLHLVEMHLDLDEVGGGGASIGFQTRAEVFDPAAYCALAEHPKTVAIGECGLDWHRMPDGHDPIEVRRYQEDVFRQQITLAQEQNLPLMIHVRDGVGLDARANDAVIRILADMQSGWRMDPPFGVTHCYAGTWAQAQRYLELGYDISFTGIVTFRPTKKQLPLAEELRRVVRGIPLDRFHVETDAPYLAPEPHRGERNEPSYVRYVAEAIAELQELPFEEIARASVANTLRLFRKMRA